MLRETALLMVGVSIVTVVTGTLSAWVVTMYRFPGRALVVERVPETVMERVIAPGAWAVGCVADAARRMQHGRLHLYILYVFLGVTALGLMILLGGM